MSRLSIKTQTLRNLAIKSKNQCAFPGCSHPILNSFDDYIAELCHIEAAEPGGQRYNPGQSDEDRRSIENLLFMCHAHHKETDNVVVYTVARLREIKKQHESLPDVVFNQEILLEAIEKVQLEQLAVKNMLTSSGQALSISNSYSIVGPELAESWTPENGRFYETKTGVRGKFIYMMRDGWLHIEQTLEDGHVGYYEVNEQGDVRHTTLPYPISEYRVIIPEKLILSRERLGSSCGTHAVKTILKWSIGSVTEHFIGTQFSGVDCNARCVINQAERTISVLA